MVSKNNHYLNQKKSGRKFEKYSIKKLKVGAASVLVSAGFFFGYHVEASEVTATENVVNAKNTVLDDKKITIKPTGETTPNNKDVIVTEKPAETEKKYCLYTSGNGKSNGNYTSNNISNYTNNYFSGGEKS